MDLELVAEGLQFPEGPVAMNDGSIIFVEIRRGTLSRVRPDGTIHVVADLGGGPNGAAIGPDGAVYVCNNGGFKWVDHPDGRVTPAGMPDDYETGSIQRVDLATGRASTLYTECDGRRLRGPNDIVFDRSGGFWFTDLGKANAEFMQHGALYYARPNGSKIVCARDMLATPNGVGLSPDESTVYVAETLTSRLWCFDILEPGRLRPPPAFFERERVLGPLPGFQRLDSLAVEAGGNICVATLNNGGITIFDPTGGFSHVPIPDPMTTNICFGGGDMRDAWITASSTGRLYKTRWPKPGLQLNFNA